MTTVAMLSLHTSPLAQPGVGDSGGMNVYVRELAGSLARGGVDTTVFVRRDDPSLPDVVSVEPHFDVVHVAAGDPGLPKEQLPDVIDEFADGVSTALASRGGASVLHANYWLSAVAGHRLSHELDIPLVSTFHTLGRVKRAGGDVVSDFRVESEAAAIGCSAAVCASGPIERSQLIELYGADETRVEVVPPAVHHAFFSPGDREGARRALGMGEHPTWLFVGRIQPLKGLSLVVDALVDSADPDTRLVVVGGASGVDGDFELVRVRSRIEDAGISDRVQFVDPQPHHLLSTWYRAADVVVVPSRSESFGLVALEAAACGVPVVAADVGGLSELVADGVTGRLLAERDPILWASVLDGITGDEDVRGRMGMAAADVGRSYSWASTAGRLRRLYNDVTAVPAVASCGVGR